MNPEPSVLDLTLTLGDLLQAGVVIVAAVALYTRIQERLARIETKLEPLWLDYNDRRKK